MDPSLNIMTNYLEKLLNVYEPFESFANSHFGSFFTDSLWEKYVPKGIQQDLNNLESINNFINVFPKVIRNNDIREFGNKHPNVVNFIQTAINMSLVKYNKLYKLPSDLKMFDLKSACNENCDPPVKGFMSEKKFHEINEVSKIIGQLKNMTNSSHIVDIGGGKGYLSSLLAFNHSYKVLGLDSSAITTCGAVKRSEKIATLFTVRDESQNKGKMSSKETQKEFIKNHYKQVVTFVEPQTNIMNLLEEQFEEKVKGVTLTGLHTCGDLAPTCLKMFLNNEEVKAILNVGCCYHLCTEEFLEENFDNKFNNYGFPLSEYLKKRKFILGRNARMLASYSPMKYSSDPESNEYSQTSLFYRAILEIVIKNSKSDDLNNRRQIGKLAKKCNNFQEYIHRAVQLLNLNIQMSESDVDKLYNDCHEKKLIFTAFFLLRITLAPIIESIILIDRILYLIENNINNAYLVRLFNLEISPRGFGIIAWKDFDRS